MFSSIRFPSFRHPSSIFGALSNRATSSFIPARVERFKPFEEARELVRQQGIKSQHEYLAWSKSGRPSFIPSRPDIVYKGCGYDGIADFCGYPCPVRGSRRYHPAVSMDPKVVAHRSRLEVGVEGVDWMKSFLEARGYDVFRLPHKLRASLLVGLRGAGGCSSPTTIWVPIVVRTTTTISENEKYDVFRWNHIDRCTIGLGVGVACLHIPSKNTVLSRPTQLFCIDSDELSQRKLQKLSIRTKNDPIYAKYEVDVNSDDVSKTLNEWARNYGKSRSPMLWSEFLLRQSDLGWSLSRGLERIMNLYEEFYISAGVSFEWASHCEHTFNTVVGGHRMLHRTAIAYNERYRTPLRYNVGEGFRRPFAIADLRMDFLVSVLADPDAPQSSAVAAIFVHPRKVLEQFALDSDCTAGQTDDDDNIGACAQGPFLPHFLVLYPPWIRPPYKNGQELQAEHMKYFIDLRNNSDRLEREKNVEKLLSILSQQ